MAEPPHVFENGTVTITINQDGFRFYVGTLEVQHIKQAGIDLNILNKPDISIQMLGNEPLEIDEMLRIVKTLPWIKII